MVSLWFLGRLSSDVSKRFSKDFLVNSVHFDTNLIGAAGYEKIVVEWSFFDRRNRLLPIFLPWVFFVEINLL